MELTEFKNQEAYQALVTRKSNLPLAAKKISSEDQFKDADEALVAIKQLKRQTEDFRKSVTGPMDDRKKAIMDLVKVDLLNDLDTAEEQLTTRTSSLLGSSFLYTMPVT